jgi:hypothetical protein
MFARPTFVLKVGRRNGIFIGHGIHLSAATSAAVQNQLFYTTDYDFVKV